MKKDNWILGIALGAIVPLAIYGIILFVMKNWGTIDEVRELYYMRKSTMQLVGIFCNMFTFRYYMVNLKLDKTGRGILLATFIYAGIFVYLHFNG